MNKKVYFLLFFVVIFSGFSQELIIEKEKECGCGCLETKKYENVDLEYIDGWRILLREWKKKSQKNLILTGKEMEEKKEARNLFDFSLKNSLETLRDKLKSVWEENKKKYLSKEEPEKKRLPSYVFKPFRLRLVKKAGYEKSIGNRVSYVRNLSEDKTLSFSVNFSPMELKDPNSLMKMDFWDYSLGYRKYFRDKYYFQIHAGLQVYDPNDAFVSWYSAKNQTFSSDTIPYLSLGLGSVIIKKLPWFHKPLVLSCTYTFSDEFLYPSLNPSGEYEHDSQGFKLGLSIRYRI